MTEEHFNALPVGYRLNEYVIKSVLGHGGFGITYLAYDENLNKDVAIKEYLPAEFAIRQGTETVRPRSSVDGDDYEWGLERFMKEAQTLALFRHPSIVPVYRFFKANGTAYMVMEYQQGESLAALMRKHRGEFTEEDLLGLVEPILDGLAEVHKAGYLHRDVKPGNIYIRQDGSPVLLDFGAARAAVGRKSQSLTSIVTPGYAPLEQYFADGNQGPWTDIYALGAILYQAVAGKIPPEAPARVKNDPITPAQEVGKGRYSPLFLAAVDRALMVEEEHRPQTTTEWRDMLIGRTSAFPAAGAAGPAAPGEDHGATMLAGAPGASGPSVSQHTAGPATGPTLGPPGGPVGGGPVGSAADQPFQGRQPVTEPPPPRRSGTGLKVAVVAGLAVLLLSVSAGAGYFVLRGSGGLEGLFGSDGQSTDARSTTDPNDPKTKVTDAEAERRRAEEEARRRAEAEAARKAEEERKRAEAERQRREQEARRRQEEERLRREAKERQRLEEERLQDEDARRRREEEARRRAEEERRRREEEERRRTQTARLPDGVSCPNSLSALNGLYGHATDCFYVRRVFISALSTGIKGSTSRWSNSKSGNSGTLTVLQAIQRADGTFCRRFQQTVTANGVTRSGVGLACFVGNEWQISG